MTHHPIVVQALYYCIVAIVPMPQPRKPQTCNNILNLNFILVYFTMGIVISEVWHLVVMNFKVGYTERDGRRKGFLRV
jgi:hypothetical protein